VIFAEKSVAAVLVCIYSNIKAATAKSFFVETK